MPLDPEKNKIINLGTITEEPEKIADQVGFTKGNNRDQEDWFKFTLDKKSDFNLTLDQLQQNADVILYGSDRRSLLDTSKNQGQEPENINNFLDAGSYFLKVVPKGSDKTDYLLSLNAITVDRSGDELNLAENLGSLGKKGLSANDSIGFTTGTQRDFRDYYKFNLNEESDVTISLDELKQNANIELLDRTGSLLFSSSKSGVEFDRINTILEPDTYYVLVEPFSSDRTDYRLNLVANPDIKDKDGQIGNNLKKLTTSKSIVDDIGFNSFRDTSDFYEIELKQESAVSITLDGLKTDANLELYDRYSSLPLYTSDKKGTRIDKIEEILPEDTYYVRVKPKSSGGTSYKLGLATNKDFIDPDGLFPGEDLGELTQKEDIARRGTIGFKNSSFTDKNDYYQFALKKRSEVGITLDDLDANANIRLLDINGREIAKSDKAQRNSESILETLSPGTYSLHVYPFGRQRTDYRFRLNADPVEDDYPNLTLAKELGNLNLQNALKERNKIGFKEGTIKDENDFYRFELSDKSEVSLTLDGLIANADIELLDKEGKKIDESKKAAKNSEQINQLLEPGSYYVNVLPFGAQKTPYRLELRTEPYVDEYDSLETAKNLGALAPVDPNNPAEVTSKIRDRNRIGFKKGTIKDENDFFRFEVTEESNVSLVLDGLNANAELELLDKEGKNIGESKRAGKSSEQINQLLEPGSYYVNVLPFGAQKTPYRLELKAEVNFEEYDSLETAKNLGALTPVDPNNPAEVTSKIRDRNRIGFKQGSSKDENDFFRFELTEKSDISLVLDGLNANAELELLDENGKNIDESKKAAKNSEQINQLLEPGTYYAKVLPFGAQKTNYRLELSASPGVDPDGNLPGTSLGDLTVEGRFKERDRIGFKQGSITDEKDYYSFTLSEPGSFSLQLDNLTANANATLFKPIDPNLPIVDESNLEVIWEGTKAGKNPESFQDTLAAGSYYVKLDRFGAQKTNYNLTLNSKPIIPLISIEDASTPEGNIGIDGNPTVTNLPFEVKLSEPSPKAVTVNYAVINNNATPLEDYNPVSGTLTFAPEDTSEQILVPVLGDNKIEPTERFLVELSAPVNGKIPVKPGANQARGIIENDDLPKLSIADVTVTEGNSGTSTAVLTLSLDDKFNEEVRVEYVTADGTATKPSDYTKTSGTLVVAPNLLNRRFKVPIKGDKQVELDETFTVELLEPKNAEIADGQTLVTIQDNDLPRISIDEPQVSLPEGNLGSDNLPTITNYPFNVSLSSVSPKTVTVNYTVEGKNATVGEDFTATTGTLSFAPEETTKQIFVPVLGDNSIETIEKFFVKLSAPVDAKLQRGGDEAMGIIQNDDFPKVSVADVTVTEKNSGTTDAVFTVSLDAALQEEVSVEYVTADGTATKLSDYIRTSGVVVFRPGQTSRRFSVPVKGDELVEGNETFIVNLINPENADIADGQAVATIIDNDVAVEPRSRKGSDFLTDGGDSDRSSSGDYTVIAEFGDDGGSFGGYGLDGAAVSAENEAELIGIAEDSGFSFV